jgi:arylsulfatase A-like enzyme
MLTQTVASQPHILHVVADDLGANDLGIKNGGKTLTPTVDGLINEGVDLESYYTFKVCGPSRTSIMTGRCPWRTGYYDMIDDIDHCVDKGYKMLPALLKEQGYSTHAIGKWYEDLF